MLVGEEEREDRIIVCNMAGQRIWWKSSETVISCVGAFPGFEEGLGVIPSVMKTHRMQSSDAC